MDNDLIKREVVRDALYDADAVTMRGVAIINTLPAVDAVEVVRCKDCDNMTFVEGGMVCTLTMATVEEKGFCNYGERKTE